MHRWNFRRAADDQAGELIGGPAKTWVIGGLFTLAILAAGATRDVVGALSGAALGAAISLVSLGPLFLLVRLFSAHGIDPHGGTRLVLLTLIVKLPALVIFLYLATRLRPTGLACFLAEVGLVYFATVWVLAGRTIRGESIKGHS